MTFFRSTMAMGLLVLAACNSNSSNAPIKTGTSAEITNTVVSCDTSKVPKNDNIVFLQVTSGCIAIQLLPELAPNHVKRITELVKKGFYDGIVFHRVIDGFMAQTGDPTGTGRGGSDMPNLKAEFSDERFVRGTLGMARSRSNDSANSQFFIMFAPGDFLNGKYTVFGKVIQGMEHVERIKKGDQADNGAVSDPDKIIKMQMAPDS
jgi:peptidylprolyl isomerase